MTRAEALARIDRLGARSSGIINTRDLDDARKLVELLPDRALDALPEGWIRTPTDLPDRIEFFWSKSASFMTPGNRILSIQTLEAGEYAVELGNSFAIEWQQAPDGKPIMDRISLHRAGAEALIAHLVDWQLG